MDVGQNGNYSVSNKSITNLANTSNGHSITNSASNNSGTGIHNHSSSSSKASKGAMPYIHDTFSLDIDISSTHHPYSP